MEEYYIYVYEYISLDYCVKDTFDMQWYCGMNTYDVALPLLF